MKVRYDMSRIEDIQEKLQAAQDGLEQAMADGHPEQLEACQWLLMNYQEKLSKLIGNGNKVA